MGNDTIRLFYSQTVYWSQTLIIVHLHTTSPPPTNNRRTWRCTRIRRWCWPTSKCPCATLSTWTLHLVLCCGCSARYWADRAWWAETRWWVRVGGGWRCVVDCRCLFILWCCWLFVGCSWLWSILLTCLYEDANVDISVSEACCLQRTHINTLTDKIRFLILIIRQPPPPLWLSTYCHHHKPTYHPLLSIHIH